VKKIHYSGLGREEHIKEPKLPEWRKLRERQSVIVHGNNKPLKRPEYSWGDARVRGHGIINSKERLDDGIITLESKVRSPQDAIAHGTGEFVTHKA
jgi:hypothetical protein